LNGIFITFEGVEGCGKSTQITLLRQKLESLGHDVLVTREPGGAPGQSPAGESIRRIVLDPATGALDAVSELFLFSAARRELVSKIIAPALQGGKIVLCDRFADSTAAYQGFARGMDLNLIAETARTACGEVWPHRTVLLDISVEEGLNRAGKRMESEGRSEARFEDEGLKFHQKVRAGFLEIAKSEPGRVKIVNAVGDVTDVANAVFDAVKDVLPPAKQS